MRADAPQWEWRICVIWRDGDANDIETADWHRDFAMAAVRPRPIQTGEILREDFLPEYDLTAGALAKALHVPRDRIEKLVRGQRAVTADTAVRLARYFGTTPQFWMNLQANHDLALVDERRVSAIKTRAA